MTQIVSTGTSGMGKKPQSMRAQGPPSHTGEKELFRVSVYGQWGYHP